MTENLSIKTKASMIALCTVFYGFAVLANQWLLQSLGFSSNNDWMFITGGAQLLLTLVFIDIGGLSIFLAALTYSLIIDTNQNLVFAFVTATIQAIAPMLARRIAIDLGGIEHNLTGLRSKQLLKLCVLFAALSAALNQLWLTWIDPAHEFLQSTLVMAVSYWLGTACMLSLLSLTARKINTWVRH